MKLKLINGFIFENESADNKIIDYFRSISKDVLFSPSAHTNYGLARVYSYLIKKGHNVDMEDVVLKAKKFKNGKSALETMQTYMYFPDRYKIKINEILNYFVDIMRLKDYDLLGVSLRSGKDIYITLLLLKLLKLRFPKIKIILGGSHIYFVNKLLLEKENFVDYVIIGHGEIALDKILQYQKPDKIEETKIPGLIYRKDNKIFSNKVEMFSMNDAECPDYTPLIPEKKYWTIPYMLFEGCCFNCNFCAKPNIKPECIDIDRAVKDIKFLVSKYQNKCLSFNDLDFFSNENKLLEFCEKIIKNKINIKWVCKARPRRVKEDFFKRLYIAGCRHIAWGIESGSKKSLSFMNKNIDIDLLPSTLNKSFESGICNTILLMSDMFWETEVDIRKTISLLHFIRKNVFMVGINEFSLHKTSPFHTNAEKYGIRYKDDNPYSINLNFRYEKNKGYERHSLILKYYIRKLQIPIMNEIIGEY